MSPSASHTPGTPKRAWLEPTLTKHESLSVLTQQYYPQQDPYAAYPGYPFGTYADSTPGSGGFFPP